MNRKKLSYFAVILIVVLCIMVKTTPSKQIFDKWMAQKFEINCEVDQNSIEICYKDGKVIDFKSSHFRNNAIFASYEKKYQYDDGESVILRTFGIFGVLFKMNQGTLWEIIN